MGSEDLGRECVASGRADATLERLQRRERAVGDHRSQRGAEASRAGATARTDAGDAADVRAGDDRIWRVRDANAANSGARSSDAASAASRAAEEADERERPADRAADQRRLGY